jgi:hypothetical protein
MRANLIATWIVVAGLCVSLDDGDARSMGALEASPQLGDVYEEPRSVVDDLMEHGRLTPSVRDSTYGGLVKSHPLVAEAALILSEELSPYAQGVYVTSLTRAPEDQRRLMKTRRYRYWTIQRSKHLLGYAADIGFYRRRKSMRRLHAKSEAILMERLGPEKFSKLRVVRESRCIHVELNTATGREEIQERTALLAAMGIIDEAPKGWYPIPELRSYVPENVWLRRPRDLLEAQAH